jgi:hypothetical protein
MTLTGMTASCDIVYAKIATIYANIMDECDILVDSKFNWSDRSKDGGSTLVKDAKKQDGRLL